MAKKIRRPGKPFVQVIIQARMSSSRFPGKVLAPLLNQPVVAHLLQRVLQAVPRRQVVVATSRDRSDDPLAAFLKKQRITIYRGDLNHVLLRFQRCLKTYRAQWFFRLCADSPLLDPAILTRMLIVARQNPDVDLITNVGCPGVPSGQHAELIRSGVFLSIDPFSTTPEENEHVTKIFYHHPDRYRILRVSELPGGIDAQANYCVDQVNDLARLAGYLGAVRPEENSSRKIFALKK